MASLIGLALQDGLVPNYAILGGLCCGTKEAARVLMGLSSTLLVLQLSRVKSETPLSPYGTISRERCLLELRRACCQLEKEEKQ